MLPLLPSIFCWFIVIEGIDDAVANMEFSPYFFYNCIIYSVYGFCYVYCVRSPILSLLLRLFPSAQSRPVKLSRFIFIRKMECIFLTLLLIFHAFILFDWKSKVKYTPFFKWGRPSLNEKLHYALYKYTTNTTR